MKLDTDQVTIAAGGILSTQQWTCDLVSTHHYWLISSHRTSQSITQNISCEGEHVFKTHLKKEEEERCTFLSLKHEHLGHFSELLRA